MKRYIKILTLVFTLSFLWGCLEDPEVYKIIVKTDSTVEFVQGGVSLNGGIYTENEKYQPTIDSCGFCYGIEENPTLSNFVVKVKNSGVGNFNATLKSLYDGTKYYVRAFAQNKYGVVYGEEVSFVSLTKPTVKTLSLLEDNENSQLIVECELESLGSGNVSELGVCYSSEKKLPNKDNDEYKLVSNIQKGKYTVSILVEPNSKYYVRAVATNLAGVAYGEVKEILTTEATYTIKFDSNGGSGNMEDISTLQSKDIQLTSNSFTRTGYTFIGWNTKADGSGTTYYDEQNISIDSDITLYAQWTSLYTITFNANGGSGSMPSKTVSVGSSIYLPINTFTRSGYDFVDWNTNADGSGVSYTNGQRITPSRNITLYAQWKKKEAYYTITFNANGGSGSMSSKTVSAGYSVSLPANTFTRSGYEFVGWNTNADGYGVSYTNGQNITPSGNITLYAQWKKKDVYYTITFNSNGGSGSMYSTEVQEGVNYTLPSNTFSRTGYTFIGWNTRADGSGLSYNDRETIIVSGNLTLYALWGVVETISGSHNGYNYVDLGLPSGTLWATCNVGASKPEDYGKYFAWGETTTKSQYMSSTYTYSSNSAILPLNKDAANVNWGGDWRMPSKAQKDELRNFTYCTWTNTTRNGIEGYIVTSNINGNSIFLPVAGYRSSSSLYDEGTYGYYWSRSLDTSDSKKVYCLYINNTNQTYSYYTFSRYLGLPVRPVLSGTYAESEQLTKFTISFDSNGGIGTMYTIEVQDEVSFTLPINSFTHSEYLFKGWNTRADGTGISYADRETITISEDLTLYAQWQDKLTAGANGREWVDLGLPSGTLWAICNVGASQPEEKGDYFAWGETTTKITFSKSNYTYSYNPTKLPLGADAANINWGGDWRIPTKAELEELINISYTTWCWISQNGIDGYKVTSNINGNSIFLPVTDEYSIGEYWSSSLGTNYSFYASILSFWKNDVKIYDGSRTSGLSIRPVMSR